MPKTLVIVESPAKAKTIGAFLGKDYEVLASYGHVRDLPETKDDIPAELRKLKWAKLGVNVDADFEPLYVVPSDKKRRVDDLKRAMKDADRLLLATDEDREGESISWHVLQVLKPKKAVDVSRIVFHEITPEAIQAALLTPRSVDERLVRAQETRRILDRLFGYTLSPLLWKKVAVGLSAGRVQSVAVRLIVLRERERMAFVVIDYAGVEARLEAAEGAFTGRLARIGPARVAEGGSFTDQGELTDKGTYWLKAAEAGPIAERLLEARPWTVTKLETKPGFENPPEPFMTSTLQQDANRKLGLPARRTMQIAQQLYEGIDLGSGERVGLITYMRTDSLTLSERALAQAREVVADLYGRNYLPKEARQFKSKAKNAQEAHEAIRPTDLSRRPQDVKPYLESDQFKLYELIWKRTLACQMVRAEVERTRVEVTVEDLARDLVFAASGKRIVFPGFLRAYVEGSDDPDSELGDKETILPGMNEGDALTPTEVNATEHQTRPPARYNEASLVQKLEAEGVGRPSTYATIIGTVQDRGYVFKKGKELVPTWTAFAVTELLEQNFMRLVDTGFTAAMETQLDEVSEGKRDPVAHLREFYKGAGEEMGIAQQVEEKGKDIPFPAMRIDDEIVVRIGRNGAFLQMGEAGKGTTASIPEDLPPADLTPETARRLLDERARGPEAIAVDPSSGACVFVKKGRFGAYLEVGLSEEEESAGATPKRVTLPPGVSPASLGDDDVQALLRFPITLGTYPETGAEVVLAVGRYGAYLTAGDKRANVGDWRAAAAMTLDQAVAALAEGKKPWGAARQPATPILVLTDVPGFPGEIKVLSGRYGPYVTNGELNATVPKGTDPATLSPQAAAALLKAKAEAGPTKKRRFTRKKKS